MHAQLFTRSGVHNLLTRQDADEGYQRVRKAIAPCFSAENVRWGHIIAASRYRGWCTCTSPV